MANSPTIVSASLDDKEMRQSIANLVAYVKRATQTMAGDLDGAVERMNASLKKLGTPATGGSANTSATKQDTQATDDNTTAKKKNVQATKEQAQANKENKLTLDQMNQAQKRAAQVSSSDFLSHIKSQNAEIRKWLSEPFPQAYGNQAINRIVEDFKNLSPRLKTEIERVKSEIEKSMQLPFKGGDYGLIQRRQLANELREYESALERVGNRERTNSQSNISSLEKELQLIKDIKSKQEATKAFERISLMPIDNIEQAKEKLAALEELKRRVANTPLFSAAKNNQLNQAIKTTSYQITSLEAKAKADAHIVSDSVKSMNAAIEANKKASIKAEEEKRHQIVQTGLAAQDAFTKIRQNTQIQLAENTDKPIKGIKELADAITNMRRLYFDMSTAEKESPLGLALKRDIENAQKLKIAIDAYNRTLAGVSVIGTKNNANSSLGAYTELTNILKTLSDEYKRLGREERNAAKGNDLADKIQRISRATQKIQQQMNRPISLAAAMKGDEKTLDDIAYKMQRLRAYKQGIDLTKPNAANEIKQVDEALAKLQKDADKWMSKSKSMIEQNNALGRSWNYMKNRLAFYFTVGASTSFVKNLIDIRSQYELLDRSIGILIDDARKGTAMFRELSEMALKSPFTLIELGSAAKQLVAYNIAQEDVIDTTRRLADMAAAVGLPIERLTYALGQVKAYGYLNSRDARIFLNAGIPIVQMLADMYNKQRDLDEEMVTAGQVREMMQKRLVSYADVMKVVNEATDEGGRFFNFQEKAADTLKVRLANLNLAWNNLLNDIGKSEQGAIQTGIKGLTTLFKHWRELYQVIMTVLVALGAYKTGAVLASFATSQLAKNVVAAGTASKGLAVAIKSIPFAGWVSIIASVISYLFIFNDSLGDVGRKLQEITEDLDGFSKRMSDMYVKVMSSKKLSDQLEELRNMIRSFENEFGVTIPVNLEDVNEGNIKAKIKEVKDRIDSYLAFASVFTTTGAENERLKESFDEFGQTANNVLNLITTNLSLVKQGMLETGKTAEEIKIFDKKEGESTIEYLQRIIKLYEKLGLFGEKEVEPMINKNFFLAYFKSTTDNVDELEERQDSALKNLGIKNKEVFRNMMENAWDYYESLGKAQYQFENFAKDLGSKIDINSIVDKKERTLKVEAAIDKYAAQNGLNQTAIELMKYLANQKFGVDIKVGIDPNAKKNTEDELQDWQRKLQQEADRNKIKLTIAFTSEQTPVSYAQEALSKVKDAMENVATQKRKEEAGTATADDVQKATDNLKKLREQARLAGADLASLDKKGSKGGSKKDILGEALSKEVQLITDIRKRYEEYKKIGVDAQTALTKATEEYGVSLKTVKNTLGKFGITGLEGVDVANMEMRDLVKKFDEMKRTASLQGNVKGVEALEKAIAALNVEITKVDYKKITDGLNNELGKLKDEYELAVELDANPELGGMFLDMFGIDKSALSSSIDDYMFAVQNEFRKKSQELGYSGWGIDVFKANEDTWKEWGKNAGLSDEALDKFKAKFVEAQDVVKKTVKDTITQTKELQYKLSDTEGKIAIETTKLKKLQADREIAAQKSKNQSLTDEQRAFYAQQKELLDLQIQDQENTIARLGDEVLQMLPTYKNLFNSIVEHSDYATRKIAKQWKNALDNAVKNANGTYTIKDPNDPTKTTTISAKQYGTEVGKVDKELRKSLSTLKKLQEAFSKGDDKTVDWAKGVELLGEEFQKLSSLADSVSSIASLFTNPNEYSATAEALSDISSTLSGMSNIASGIGKIASGDYISGAASVLSGIISVIGAWADNSDKKILQQIKDSELAVKRLENEYKKLQQAIDDAYGVAEIGAKRAAIANKEIQLLELKRQLQLEESRKSKKRDADKIEDLKGQIIDLELEIKNATREIVSDLTGITSVGDAAESMVLQMIEAFKKGEDYMGKYSETFENMIDNMIMKAIVGKVIGEKMEEIFNRIQEIANQRADKTMVNVKDIFDDTGSQWVRGWINEGMYFSSNDQTIEQWRKGIEQIMSRNMTEEGKKVYSDALEKLNKLYSDNVTITPSDISSVKQEATEMKDDAKKTFDAYMEALGIVFGQDSAKELSALQQGLQGVSEETASAVESYLNGMSQQAYLRNDLLTQIRDTIMSFDMDVQLGVLSQMLLQLQNNYIVMQSMQSMMENWTVPSGSGIRVELMS